MIIDGRKIIQEGSTDCDILIVGGGPAGITLAMELLSANLRVVLLESGGREFDDRAQALNDGRLTALDTTDLTAARLRLLGGASNHWGGHCLPLDPIDFDRSPLSGLSGWPMSYEDMRLYYEKASVFCDLGNFDYSLDAIRNLQDRDLLLADEAQIEARVIRQSLPTNFGEKYFSALEASETVQLWLWTTAVGIGVDSDGLATSVDVRSIDGQAGRFTAGEVVLACGAVENARFLLANNARAEKGFGNRGGFLGACYMDHPVGGAAFLHFETPETKKANWAHNLQTQDGINAHLVWRLSDTVLEAEGLNNIQFFVIPISADATRRQAEAEARRGLQGLKSVAKWVLGREEEGVRLSASYCDLVQNADALAVHTYKDMTGGERIDRVLLRYESEQRPDRSSYVTLDATQKDAFGTPLPVLNWSPTLDDRASIVKSATKIGALAGANGLGRIELEDHFDERYWDATTAWHQMGTTRMAAAESDGVVDPNGLLFGTKNVYLAGGSIFPSGGRANPTMTIVALSVRLAEHLRRKRRV